MTALSQRQDSPTAPTPGTAPGALPPIHLPAGVTRLVPVLAALRPEQLRDLLTHAVKRRFARGEWLVRQGERDDGLFVLLSGRAHLLRVDSRQREVIIDLVRPGDHVGEMGLIDNLPHSSSVRCLQACDVLIIDGSALARTLPHRPELTRALMAGLVRRLRNAHRQIASLGLHDVQTRVMRRLSDLSELQSDGSRVVRERVSRQDLAKMVGASREMVSRIMSDLQAQGWLDERLDGSVLLLGHDGDD